MVFTIFHYLAIASLQFKARDKVDPIALALSTMLMDVEPLTSFLTGTYHWLLHSFLGASLLSVPLAFVVFLLERKDLFLVDLACRILRLEKRKYEFKHVLLTSLFGGLSHVFVDAFTHRNFPYVLFPFATSSNPFWMGFEVGHLVQAVMVLLSLYSIYLWVRNMSR